MQKPLKIEYNTFDEETYNKATLYVPQGSLEDYRAYRVWEDFLHIEEFMPTAINLSYHKMSPLIKMFYNNEGQKENTLRKGLNIIKYNDGTNKKIIINHN